MDTGSPISEGRESYGNFHKLKWYKVREQVPLPYMEKLMNVPWTLNSMLA